MTFRIKDWSTHYEKSDSRPVKSCQWVPMPNSHDGEGYAELVEDNKDGTAHFGVWCALVQIASRKPYPRNGYLTKDGTESGKAYDAASLARKARMKTKVVAEAMERLVKIGWLEVIEIQQDSSTPEQAAGIQADGTAVLQDKTLQDKTEKEEESTIPEGLLLFHTLAVEFHDIQAKNFPKQTVLKASQRKSADIAGANTLERLHRIDGWSIDDIKTLLKWIPGDDFWCPNIRSLGSIRKLSPNGSKKIENAQASMLRNPPDQSTPSTDKSDAKRIADLAKADEEGNTPEALAARGEFFSTVKGES